MSCWHITLLATGVYQHWLNSKSVYSRMISLNPFFYRGSQSGFQWLGTDRVWRTVGQGWVRVCEITKTVFPTEHSSLSIIVPKKKNHKYRITGK